MSMDMGRGGKVLGTLIESTVVIDRLFLSVILLN